MPRTRKKEPINRDEELFGARLKELRLKRGMTLQALANEAEMSLTYLKRHGPRDEDPEPHDDDPAGCSAAIQGQRVCDDLRR